ncbi:hypothetical protein F5Y07DRAFT_381287 [Xylaria sp. FL0933]|nr:hypothetical protein F5Y07DRAFT_381287 [Xylaria sp. FL0933]
MSVPTAHFSSLFTDASTLWKNGNKGIEEALAHLAKSCAEDVKFNIVGQEFQLAGEVVGIDAAKDFITGRIGPAYLSSLDTTAPMERDVNVLINGAAGEWSVAQMTGKGTSKKGKLLLPEPFLIGSQLMRTSTPPGKPWHHESLVLLKSNSEGKWAEIKVYMDTLHIQNHILEAAR